MNNTNNKAYWENYVKYWQERVKKTNDGEQKDKTTSDIIQEVFFELLNVEENEKFLDYGCGTARMYEKYKTKYKNCNYYGCEISHNAIEIAIDRFPELNNHMYETDGETVALEDNSFDKIFCFAVLDACNQEKVISELIRITRVGGRILLTGKNFNYHNTDELALDAENGAKKKNFPNHFTDVKSLEKQLINSNVKIIDKFYYEKRGDFSENKYKKEEPAKFYEWCFLIEKTTNERITFSKFCYEESKTYMEFVNREIK